MTFHALTVSILAVHTKYVLMIIRYDSSWQLVQQSTALTSVRSKCLYPKSVVGPQTNTTFSAYTSQLHGAESYTDPI